MKKESASTDTTSELTIVIPAKNEAKLISNLLNSLASQDYSRIASTKVLVADAGSTDGTQDIVMSFRDRLDISVIPGGLPSRGRNAGAARATTPYVLFVDADIALAETYLLRHAMHKVRTKRLHCVTTNVICRDGGWLDKLFYAGSDIFQYLSWLHRPFSTGMFMLFEKKRFDELGGFNEGVHFAEDYLLSMQVDRMKFSIVRGGVYTTNRRMQKLGYTRVAWLFFVTAFNFWNRKHFLRDHKYWQEEGREFPSPPPLEAKQESHR